MSEPKQRTYYVDTDDLHPGPGEGTFHATFLQPKLYTLASRGPEAPHPLVQKLQARADMNARTARLHGDLAARLESQAKADAYRNAVKDATEYATEELSLTRKVDQDRRTEVALLLVRVDHARQGLKVI